MVELSTKNPYCHGKNLCIDTRSVVLCCGRMSVLYIYIYDCLYIYTSVVLCCGRKYKKMYCYGVDVYIYRSVVLCCGRVSTK